MYPARHTRSTLCCCSAAIISASCSDALRSRGWNRDRRQPQLARRRQPGRIRDVRQHHRNLRTLQSALADRLGNREEVRTPPGEQNSKSLQAAPRALRLRSASSPRRSSSRGAFAGADRLRFHLLDRLVQQRDVRHVHPLVLAADDDGRRVLHAQLLAQRVVGLHFLRSAVRVGSGTNGICSAVRLEELARERQHVVLAHDAHLRREHRRRDTRRAIFGETLSCRYRAQTAASNAPDVLRKRKILLAPAECCSAPPPHARIGNACAQAGHPRSCHSITATFAPAGGFSIDVSLKVSPG